MSLPVETVLSLLQAHPYLLLFPLVLLEGPIATVAAGLFVATGLMEWPVAYAIAVSADLAGDSLYYALGRGARRPGVGGPLARLGLKPERLAATVPKAGLLMALGFFAGGQVLALLQHLDPGPAVLLALLVVAPVAALLGSKKVSGQAPVYAEQTTIKEENR